MKSLFLMTSASKFHQIIYLEDTFVICKNVLNMTIFPPYSQVLHYYSINTMITQWNNIEIEIYGDVDLARNRSFWLNRVHIYNIAPLLKKLPWKIRVNSLWPNDAIRRHRSGSTLAQAMACRLMAPSHYLNQCWLIISKVHWHSSEGNFAKDTSATNHKNQLEITFLKLLSNLPGANELMNHMHWQINENIPLTTMKHSKNPFNQIN